MKIDFTTNDSWSQMNQRLTKKLGLADSNCQVKLYKGMSHALTEITSALVKGYPHKVKSYYFRYMDPLFEQPMLNLTKDGFDVEMESLPKDIPNVQEEFLSGVAKNALFTLLAHHDPFLGRLWQTDDLVEKLNELKHFSLLAFHLQSPGLERIKNIGRFQCFIVSIHQGLAVAFMGARMKINGLITQTLPWTPEDVDAAAQFIQNEPENFSAQITQFEEKNVAGAQAYFSKDTPRLFDRSVIFWEDMDATAILQDLKGSELLSPGQERDLETTSLSRWGGVKTMDWLKQQGVSPDVVRGLLIVDGALIGSEFETKLAESRQRILNLQGQ